VRVVLFLLFADDDPCSGAGDNDDGDDNDGDHE